MSAWLVPSHFQFCTEASESSGWTGDLCNRKSEWECCMSYYWEECSNPNMIRQGINCMHACPTFDNSCNTCKISSETKWYIVNTNSSDVCRLAWTAATSIYRSRKQNWFNSRNSPALILSKWNPTWRLRHCCSICRLVAINTEFNKLAQFHINGKVKFRARKEIKLLRKTDRRNLRLGLEILASLQVHNVVETWEMQRTRTFVWVSICTTSYCRCQNDSWSTANLTELKFDRFVSSYRSFLLLNGIAGFQATT